MSVLYVCTFMDIELPDVSVEEKGCNIRQMLMANTAVYCQ